MASNLIIKKYINSFFVLKKMFLKIFFPNIEVTRRSEIIKRKQYSNQVIDFTDAVDRKKRNKFKGSHFVIGIDLSNNKKNLSLNSVIGGS